MTLRAKAIAVMIMTIASAAFGNESDPCKSDREAWLADKGNVVVLERWNKCVIQRTADINLLLSEIEKTRKFGLTIIRSSIADVSEYTEGTSFRIQVLNSTNKTIKYIWLTVIGINAVNDPVRDPLKSGPALTVKAIGPIEKDESGTYEWQYMWHTDIVERFRISAIKVQYMDNSVRTIRNADSVTLTPEALRIFEE